MTSKFVQSMLLRLVGLTPGDNERAHRAATNVLAQYKAHSPEYWSQYGRALGIATDAGVLKVCSFHDGSYFAGSKGIDPAYELGRRLFVAGKLKGSFDSIDTMNAMILKVVSEQDRPHCAICDSNP